MSKYEPLKQFLVAKGQGAIPMSFEEIERLVGEKLPPSAFKHRPWWSNNPSNSVITRAWLEAGYKTSSVDMAGRKLIFRKTEDLYGKKVSLSLKDRFRNLRGTIRVTVDVDLTEPVGETWHAVDGSI
ncbi:MAG: hypothetical protein CMK06_05985 [Ponticaulis sp.]|nr:hypothetical protein [Ponticaulis sp.]